MKGGKRYKSYLQEAVEGAYHTKHLEKGDTQKDSRGPVGWGVVWWPKEKKVPDLTHLAPAILVRKRPT